MPGFRRGSRRPQQPQPVISRRDFIDGIAVSIGAGLIAPAAAAAAPRSAAAGASYPPALTGLRGAHVGSFEALHSLRDGSFWGRAPAPVPSRETYDLVVVGAGISGLTAAYAFRKARPQASILILDNHEDFGGHATRNELSGGGARRIGYGGSQSIDSPAPYSAAAKALLTELGVRVSDFDRYSHKSLYSSLGCGPAFFFDRETFGSDQLVKFAGRPEQDAAFISSAPISYTAKRDLARLVSERFDPFAGEPVATKRAKLARMSYLTFLQDHWKVDPAGTAILKNRTHGLYGVGIDAVPAQDAHGLDLPGFQGMELGTQPGPGQNYDSIRSPEAAAFYFHFPDGNATLARLLVRQLIPAAVSSQSVASAVAARVNYGRLDAPGSSVRLRLLSPVVRVKHKTASGRAPVEITYVQSKGQPQSGMTLRTVTANRVILACWHSVIPYVCTELAQAQAEALAYGIKVPIVYTNVLIRNWEAWTRLGVSRIACPGFWHTSVSLDQPVSIGTYKFPQKPSEPIVLHLSKTPCRPGLSARDQHRAGRRELYETPFEDIERSIRTQLDRLLGSGGFDAGRDILAITVNRWPHGYAYQYNSLFDDFWLEGRETPCEVARRPFGRIAIANADAGAYSYADAAIDHGLRAAREVLAVR